MYEIVKGLLIEEELEKEGEDFLMIEFYSENIIKLYDIDFIYID